MARIFFSLSGEGRGHATRVRAVVDELCSEHEVTIYTSGFGYDFLGHLYAPTDVRVIPIEGMHFHYAQGRVNFRRTLGGVISYLRQLRQLVERLRLDIIRERPDLIVTDFEPALPRAALQCQVPFVSLDHQHCLLAYDLSSLPIRSRWHARYMGWIVRAYYSGQKETIVSSFYHPPLRPGYRNVTQSGVMLRSLVRDITPVVGDHLVAYFRRFASGSLLAALDETGIPTHVYGLGERPAEGWLTFHPIHEKCFVEDLASCAALIATAGNQLVGEALYLGKPAFVVPEPSNHEQYINAYFLKNCGAGNWAEMERVKTADVRHFVANLDRYRSAIDVTHMDGLPVAMRVLQRYLPSGLPRSRRRNPVLSQQPHRPCTQRA
jgi:uncharacterized protein (TIGR00661 family)